MGKGEGHGAGHGEGQGKDAVEGVAAGGAAACCFLVFMWVIGLPMLLAGIAIVNVFSSGGAYTAGIILIVISCICIVIGIVLIILFCVIGANTKTTPATTTQTVHVQPLQPGCLNTTTTVHQTHGVQVAGTAAYTTGAQPGYGAPLPGYSQYPAQPPPYSQNIQQYNNPYPQPGTQPTTITTTTATGQPVVNPYQPQPAESTAHPAPPSEGQIYPSENKHPGFKGQP